MCVCLMTKNPRRGLFTNNYINYQARLHATPSRLWQTCQIIVGFAAWNNVGVFARFPHKLASWRHFQFDKSLKMLVLIDAYDAYERKSRAGSANRVQLKINIHKHRRWRPLRKPWNVAAGSSVIVVDTSPRVAGNLFAVACVCSYTHEQLYQSGGARLLHWSVYYSCA